MATEISSTFSTNNASAFALPTLKRKRDTKALQQWSKEQERFIEADDSNDSNESGFNESGDIEPSLPSRNLLGSSRHEALIASKSCGSCNQLNVSSQLQRQNKKENMDMIAVRRLLSGERMEPHDCTLCKLLVAQFKGQGALIEGAELSSRYSPGEVTDLLRKNSWWTIRPDVGSWIALSRYLDLKLEGTHDEFSKLVAGDDGRLVWRSESFGMLDRNVINATGRRRAVLSAVGIVHDRPDYPLITEWLHRCEQGHAKCKPQWSGALRKIRLINVDSLCLVSYPGNKDSQCEYYALSYVWGGYNQPRVSQLGRLTHSLPRTIRDAVKVVKQLGGRYLWVDSICIDQEDDVHKSQQVARMDAIYLGAFATIIALDGVSANSGLNRVSADVNWKPQLLLSVEGKKMAERFPTLAEHIARSRWATRGWTYQEGVLSRRRICFTRHQVYFRCNERHYGEQTGCLPIARSRVRSDSALLDPISSATQPPPLELSGKQALFAELISSYTRRTLSRPSDALDAVSAVLTYCQNQLFPQGFYLGLSRGDFLSFFLWHQVSSDGLEHRRRRIGYAHRRQGAELPTWTWLGWCIQSRIRIPHFDRSMDHMGTPPLRVSTEDGKLLHEEVARKKVFEAEIQPLQEREIEDGKRTAEIVSRLVALYKRVVLSSSRASKPQPSTSTHALHIEGIILRMPCRQIVVHKPEIDLRHEFRRAVHAQADAMLNEWRYWDERWYLDGELAHDSISFSSRQQEFLLVHSSVNRYSGKTRFHLLLLLKEEGKIVRGGVVELDLKADYLEAFWQLALPRWTVFRLN